MSRPCSPCREADRATGNKPPTSPRLPAQQSFRCPQGLDKPQRHPPATAVADQKPTTRHARPRLPRHLPLHGRPLGKSHQNEPSLCGHPPAMPYSAHAPYIHHKPLHQAIAHAPHRHVSAPQCLRYKLYVPYTFLPNGRNGLPICHKCGRHYCKVNIIIWIFL